MMQGHSKCSDVAVITGIASSLLTYFSILRPLSTFSLLELSCFLLPKNIFEAPSLGGTSGVADSGVVQML